MFSDIVFVLEYWFFKNCLLNLEIFFDNKVIFFVKYGVIINNIIRGGVVFIVK